MQLGATLGIGAIIAMEYVDTADAEKRRQQSQLSIRSAYCLKGGVEDDIGSALLGR